MASCTEITENAVLQEDLQRSLRARLNVMLTEAQEAEATAGQAKHTASCSTSVLVIHAAQPLRALVPAISHSSSMSPTCCA